MNKSCRLDKEAEPTHTQLAEEEDKEEADQVGEEKGTTTTFNPELEEFSMIVDELLALPPLNASTFSEDICVRQFPQEISQSTFKGHNGNNVCRLISLLVVYIFSRNGIRIVDQGPLPHNTFRMLCGCIELRNRMYDIC